MRGGKNIAITPMAASDPLVSKKKVINSFKMVLIPKAIKDIAR